MIRTSIEVTGAHQNNLKNINVEIPRDKLIVITGVSGSGKSSLAFDVIYGEAQRRFLESLSNFAKSRINQVKKPKVDFVRGLSPVIAIEQKKGNSNPRSTIGTVTDIQDYVRLLFATAGSGKCPYCDCKLEQVTSSKMAEHILSLPAGTVVELHSAVYKDDGHEMGHFFEDIRKKGYKKVFLNGEKIDLSDTVELDEEEVYEAVVVLDSFTLSPEMYIQIAKSIEAALIAMEGDIFLKTAIISSPKPVPQEFYKNFCCPEHFYSLCELQAFHFSPNVSGSACEKCSGIGLSHVVEPRFLITNPEKSINKGALTSNFFNPSNKDSYRYTVLYSVAQHYGFSLDTPWNMLRNCDQDIILYGTKGEKIKMVQPPVQKKKNWIVGRDRSYNGIIREIENWYKHYIRRSTNTEQMEPGFIKDCMIEKICPDCNGGKLKDSRLDIKIDNVNIQDMMMMQLPDLIECLSTIKIDGNHNDVAQSIMNEINVRLKLLNDIGLHYLNLGRRSDSISGGEMQRIKMSTQISSELMGMLYVMDEPSIGLHPRDSHKVINIMKQLRDIGNTVLVVEHDLETMQNADFIVEIGPGPGVHGGNIIATGTTDEVMNNENSVTGAYLSKRKMIPLPEKYRNTTDKCITIQGARGNNLKNIDIEIPLGVFVCITGVSGSGKSTLINDTLFKQMEIIKKGARIIPGEHDYLFGSELINNVINIDQSAIGRGSKSNPATYIGLYDRIRDLFASTDDAILKGYKPIDFSLTHANGTRCEHCTGDGVIITNLQFMADIETMCPVCKGSRFSQEGLEVKYNGADIGQVLNMTVEEALKFFNDNTYLSHKLGIMNELGLGYITLGQSSTTLSGGEAQRVKLAYELAKIKRGTHNLYILDEPTTGLHLSDIERLLQCINKLIDQGHTVIIIEHNLDVIKCADYIIDLGPEGGQNGGKIVAQGTPKEVAAIKESYTGQFLRSECGL